MVCMRKNAFPDGTWLASARELALLPVGSANSYCHTSESLAHLTGNMGEHQEAQELQGLSVHAEMPNP